MGACGSVAKFRYGRLLCDPVFVVSSDAPHTGSAPCWRFDIVVDLVLCHGLFVRAHNVVSKFCFCSNRIGNFCFLGLGSQSCMLFGKPRKNGQNEVVISFDFRYRKCSLGESKPLDFIAINSSYKRYLINVFP